jgi:hypothetical protein
VLKSNQEAIIIFVTTKEPAKWLFFVEFIPGARRPIVFNPDDYYPTQEDFNEAKCNGISRDIVRYRIRQLCWEKQKAITTPVKSRGKDRKHITAIAKMHGISYMQLMGRKNMGWDEQRACTAPLRDAEKARELALYASECGRKHPREVVQLAASNGISYERFLKRVKAGWGYTLASTKPVSRFNGPNRVKELYGEDFYKEVFRKMKNWIYAPGKIKKAEKNKSF